MSSFFSKKDTIIDLEHLYVLNMEKKAPDPRVWSIFYLRLPVTLPPHSMVHPSLEKRYSNSPWARYCYAIENDLNETEIGEDVVIGNITWPPQTLRTNRFLGLRLITQIP